MGEENRQMNMRKIQRNGEVGLRTIAFADLRAGDFQISGSGSSALELTTYCYDGRDFHSMGMMDGFQSRRVSERQARLPLLRHLRSYNNQFVD